MLGWALAIVVILAVLSGLWRTRRMLSGMWVGDPGFLSKAGLRSLQLFVAPGSSWTADGYLLMTESGESDPISSVPVRLRFAPGILGSLTGWLRSKHTMALRLESDGPIPFPSDLDLTLVSTAPAVVIHDGGKMYAYLVKDPAASIAAEIEWKKVI